MRMPSIWAIVILLVVVMVLFGASRLPDIASSVGKSLKIFKREVKELVEDDEPPASHRYDGAGPTHPEPAHTQPAHAEHAPRADVTRDG